MKYTMWVSPVTTVGEIHEKLKAFVLLYGPSRIFLGGRAVMDTTGECIFPGPSGVTVTKIGKRYAVVMADDEACKINLQNPNHGVHWIRFEAQSESQG